MNHQDHLLAVIEALRDEVRSLGARVGDLEGRITDIAQSASRAVSIQAPQPTTPVPQGDISEEELLALSAAIAAFLGVRARIRHVRLVHSATWAQVGRVHIQASHRVH
jgi:methylmalonyl-CoA carboxyltransferase large subunit